MPDASPELVAAAVLNDAPEFAPTGVDVPAFLSARYGEQTTHVLALTAEHQAPTALQRPDLTSNTLPSI